MASNNELELLQLMNNAILGITELRVSGDELKAGQEELKAGQIRIET
jgi:hypothetical protein